LLFFIKIFLYNYVLKNISYENIRDKHYKLEHYKKSGNLISFSTRSFEAIIEGLGTLYRDLGPSRLLYNVQSL